jgi:hypothetical protein
MATMMRNILIVVIFVECVFIALITLPPEVNKFLWLSIHIPFTVNYVYHRLPIITDPNHHRSTSTSRFRRSPSPW